MNAPMPNALLPAALHYAERGLPVLPLHTPTGRTCSCWQENACPSPGKHPRLRDGGWHDASLAPERIRAWWQEWPTANIGIALPGANLVVVDVDVKDGGLETFKHMESKFDPAAWTRMWATPRVRSGNRVKGRAGAHFLFTQSDPPVAKNCTLGPGIDVLANQLIVAAPSLHYSGHRYEWVRGADFGEIPTLPFPSELKAILVPKTPRTTTGRFRLPERISNGTRRLTYLSLCGLLRNAGATKEEMYDVLLTINRRTDNPSPPEHLWKIANDVERLYAPMIEQATDAAALRALEKLRSKRRR